LQVLLAGFQGVFPVQTLLVQQEAMVHRPQQVDQVLLETLESLVVEAVEAVELSLPTLLEL